MHDSPDDRSTASIDFPTSWVLQRPRLHVALSLLGTVLAAGFLVRGIVALAEHGHPKPLFFTYLAFWSAGFVANLSLLRRALRAWRDPEGESTRVQALRDRLLAQPRERLLRKAAAGLAVLCLVPVTVGLLVLVFGDSVRSEVFGCFSIAFGALIGLSGVWRLRHPRF